MLLALAVTLVNGPIVLAVGQDTATISWQTSDKESNATLRWGTQAGVYPNALQDPAWLPAHHVRIDGLASGTTYHFALDDDPTHEDSRFTTAPAGGAFKFIVYGDNRTDSAGHQRVVNAIRKESGIAFILNTGDMAQNYPGSQEWDAFFATEHDLLRTTPLFPTVGNHETLDSLQTWGALFSPPRFDPSNTVRYYAFDWSNAHFVVLDTFDQTGPALDPKTDTISAAQLEWLKADLDAARAQGQLIFASLHHGHASHATGSEAHGGSELVRTQVIPELVKRGAIASFAGHDHIYERGCNAGIDYFVAGGGGAPLYDADAGSDPTVYVAQSTLEYSVISVNGAHVEGVTKNADGYELDRFTLPTPGCENDAGVGSVDAGAPDAGLGPGAGAGGSCASAGPAIWLLLAPLVGRRRYFLPRSFGRSPALWRRPSFSARSKSSL